MVGFLTVQNTLARSLLANVSKVSVKFLYFFLLLHNNIATAAGSQFCQSTAHLRGQEQLEDQVRCHLEGIPYRRTHLRRSGRGGRGRRLTSCVRARRGGFQDCGDHQAVPDQVTHCRSAGWHKRSPR